MAHLISFVFPYKYLKSHTGEILIFLVLFFTGAAFHHPVEYDNSLSRFFLVRSVVERGVLNIDDNHEITIDDSFWNGHYYSNKAIGAPLLALPFYWVVNRIPFEKTPYAGLNVNIEDMYIVRVITTTLPFALLGALLFNFSVRLKRLERDALWMVLCYSFGTIAMVHAMLFSGHQISASFSFFSFIILYQLREKKVERGSRLPGAFLAGLFAGIAALSDYTAMYTALCLTIYLFTLRAGRRESLLFLSGGLICASLLAAYNYVCFDSPLSLSYAHLVEQDFREGSQSGFMGISLPDPEALFSLLLSPSRGLFFISPVLLYSVFGLYEMRKEYFREMILIVALSVGYLLINSGFYGWHGGWSYGPRYLVPVLPFVAIPMAFVIRFDKFFILLSALSLVQVSIAAYGIPHTPDIFTNPVVEFMIPLINYGYVAKSGGNLVGLEWIFGAIPVLLIAAGLIALAFYSLSPLKDLVKGPQKGPRSAALVLALYILFRLAFTHSEVAPDQNHTYKSNMLYMFSKVTNSEAVYMGGLQEELKARSYLDERAE